MKTIIGFKFTRVFAVALMLLVFSGCIKRTSTPIIEETTFRNITEKVIVSNPIGMVSLTGSNIRVFSSSVRVSKSVQTYSLLGLANPSKYLDNVLVYQSAENGELNVRVIVERLPFLDRLFVKVSPQIDLALETPVAQDTEVTINAGDLNIHNLVGNINAVIDVGKVSITSTLGVFGNQSFDVNMGAIDIHLPADMPVRYDLNTSIGSISSEGLNVEVERRLLGAYTTGAIGTTVMPSTIKGKVRVGSINFQGE